MSTITGMMSMHSSDCSDSEPHCNNPYLSQGCQLEGHLNQQMLHIFINEKDNKEFGKERFGCPECVSRRHPDRSLSLKTAVSVQKYKSLHEFPILNRQIKEDVEKSIGISNKLNFDDEINECLESLITQLKQTLTNKKEEGNQFAKAIKQKGEEMEKVYREITNCSALVQCVTSNSDNYNELNLQFNRLVKELYDNQSNNEKRIKEHTTIYIEKNQTFIRDYADSLKKQMIETIDKISFQKISADQAVQQKSQVESYEYLKAPRKFDYEQSTIEIEQIEPIDEKQKKGYKPCNIQNRGFYTISMQPLPNLKIFYNQAYTSPLTPTLTYKILFEISDIDPSKLFMIGIADFKQRNTNFYSTTTQFCKLFIPKTEMGCTFVEYGNDLAKLPNLKGLKFTMKFNISQNMIKFQDEMKTSSNTLATNVKLDQQIQYCIYFINQSSNFELKILNIQTKQVES